MKKLLFLLAIVFQSIIVLAQSYTVLHISGDIRKAATNESLQLGSSVDVSESLVFYSPKAKAVLINKEHGRIMISSEYASFVKIQGALQEQSSRITGFNAGVTATLQEAMIPQHRTGKTLKFEIFEKVSDLKSFFGTGRFAIIGDKLEVVLHEEKFMLSQEPLFVYHYQLGKDSIGKEIPYNKDVLIFNKKELYFVHGKYQNPEDIHQVHISFYPKKEQSIAQRLVTFEPVFIEENMIYQEIKTLIDFLDNPKDAEKVKIEILNFIYDVYGRPDVKSVLAWAEQKGFLPKKRS